MLVDPDFSEAVKPNVPGIYLCKIVEGYLKLAHNTGNQYIAWKLLTFPEGRIVFHNTPITGKGAGMFKHLVHSAGDVLYESGGYDTDKLLGKYVKMNLVLDESNYFKVKTISAPDANEIPLAPNLDKTDDIPF